MMIVKPRVYSDHKSEFRELINIDEHSDFSVLLIFFLSTINLHQSSCIFLTSCSLSEVNKHRGYE